MSKINTICLRCGKVQVRTDVVETLNNKYVKLKQKRICPQCNIKTEHIATKDIKELRKKLEKETNESLDGYIHLLIRR